jgi:hypothetical protein
MTKNKEKYHLPQVFSFSGNKLIVLLMVMLLGLLFSRALLSISTLVWLIVILISWRKYNFFRNDNHLLYWSIVPLILFLAGAWQLPFQKDTYDFLLTLCSYPIAFFSVTMLKNQKNISIINQIWVIVAIAGCIYPISWFITHIQASISRYGSGQTLPVLMDNDHIRYGIFLCSALVMLLFHNPFSLRFRWILIGLLLLLILFLSVRTAWIILIICLLFIPFTKSIPQRKWITVGIILLGFCNYIFFPTVQKKIAYSFYEWQQFNPLVFNSNYSDGARRNMNTIALEAIQEKQYNVGWAGVAPTMQQIGRTYFSQQNLKFGWPFIQWLFWLIGSGWIGVIAWSIWLLYPICWAWQQKQTGVAVWSIAITASCLVECNLNYQFGVFLHAWPLALMSILPQCSSL